MADIAQIEKDLLSLAPMEREQLAVKAWESLVNDVDATSDPNIDPVGLELASSRDADLDEGKVTAINKAEFRRETGGGL